MTPSENSLHIDVEIETTDTAMKRNVNTLVDCGATGLFVDTEYVRSNNLSTRRLTTPIPVYNIDGTANEAGTITEIADIILRYKGHAERTQFAVTLLGKQNMILGFTWLREHNPEID
jgi:predicted aspartyl protease